MHTIRQQATIAAPIPFAMGAQDQILNAPIPPNCPKESSIKYIGFPANINIIKYGIRKAPPPFS